MLNTATRTANYKHTIKSKKFQECEYRFGDPLGETDIQQVFKFSLCGANGNRKANYVGYQLNYNHLMPVISANGQPDYTNWKVIKRELAALDILSSPHIVIPEEFVKTKHHCYLVKEYVNGGTLSQLLLYRS